MKACLLIVLICLIVAFIMSLFRSKKDPNLWLEKVLGEKALEWVGTQNKASTKILEAVPGFNELNEKNLEIMDSKERVPYASKRGKYLYNFWQDSKNPKGIYRRTTMEEYKKENPKWEIILDVDELAKKENENWVFKGMDALYPDYTRAFLKLSRGGSDASVIREFDISTKSFVKDGFFVPEGKNMLSWRDENSVYLGADFGKDSLTDSGYPRIVKLWKRSTPLKDAKTIFETNKDSVYAFGGRMFSEEGHLDFIMETVTFYEKIFYLIREDKLVKLEIPRDADFAGYFKKQIIIKLRSDWKIGEKIYKQGAVIIGNLEEFLAGKKKFHILMEPENRLSISSINTTKNMILITVLDNVVSKIYQFTQDKKGKWRKKLVEIEENGTLSIFNTNEKSDDYFVIYQSFLTPDSLYMVSGIDGNSQKLKSRPAFFDAEPFKVEQHDTISKDGTKIPYFTVMKKDVKFDGNNPTLLYGYGGFRNSMRPYYSATRGISWLEKGGVFVLANIRGGGEFGPSWHQAALQTNRHKCFEDFIAVAENLVNRKITSPEKLGIQGGSNGGLLVGTVFIQRPDLFKAVVCEVPLLDMKRYHKLLAGASWIAEYGNPDNPKMWDYIKTYSPYQNVKKGVEYPQVYFYTSTKDDRVHPAHARKMVARMMDMGHKVFYYENTEGGHSGGADNKQRAYMSTLSYAYLYKMLMGK